jgi:hypothetical protein
MATDDITITVEPAEIGVLVAASALELPVIFAANAGPAGAPGPPGAQGEPGQDATWTSMTQAEYDALAVKDPQTLYLIIG